MSSSDKVENSVKARENVETRSHKTAHCPSRHADRRSAQIRRVAARLATCAVMLQVGGCAIQASDVASYQLLTFVRSVLVSVLSSLFMRA